MSSMRSAFVEDERLDGGELDDTSRFMRSFRRPRRCDEDVGAAAIAFDLRTVGVPPYTEG